jgi:tRNA(Ile)-lysidine synthase
MKRHPIDWPAVALRLGQLIPRERLHPEVLFWANGRPARERWAVALSGGADSTALLLLLWAHWPEKRQRLLVLHFDHRLRGKASRDDALFCRSVCLGLGVVYVGGHWSRPPKAPSEAVTRTQRFEFFQRELGRRRISALWLGQQQDDIAETLLMRLARGSGTAGLAAP